MSKDRCYVEINLDNYRDNVINLQKVLPAKTKIIGIVKANYYGHGAKELAEVLLSVGINDFAVATLSEAITLRAQGIKGSMLILGYVEKESWLLAKKHDCILTCVDENMAKEMAQFANENNVSLKIEVKVDTGMHRIGVNPAVSDETLKLIYGNSALKVNGTYSHLSCGDSFIEEDRKYTKKQKQTFDEFIDRVNKLGYQVGRTHLVASSGIMNYPEFVYDYVRPGFMLLGYDLGSTNELYVRKPVLSWYSKIEQIKEVPSDSSISYGRTYISQETIKVATISVGYGDGYPRRLSNKGYVMINNTKAKIIGRICMDQMIVDVTGIDCKVEDIVTLIGEGITVSQLAELADTIGDEIVCGINARVSRYYFGGKL